MNLNNPPRRVFRIVDWTHELPLNPYAVLDETGAVRLTGPNPHRLSDYAFDHGADDVRHDYDLLAWERR